MNSQADNTFPGPVPKEALAYFRTKKLKPGFDFRDVWREEHATAFTVAKAMETDILQALHAGVDEALEHGLTYQQFSTQLTPLLQKLGWWGKRVMDDPLTGEEKIVQLGSPRRLRTIYNANLRTARAAGQWQRAERTQKSHPYLLYQLGPSENHREEHVAWVGTILPIDHPWWDAHFPPNGWGCKCHVRQISKREHERLVASGNYLTEPPKGGMRNWTNKRTGEVERVPVGIDPGWDTNPGKLSRPKAAKQQLKKKQVALKKEIKTPPPQPIKRL
ncbi:hypothetical protein BOW53_02960 [Solemya pervernicosa gill symbiont]|uniref:Phage head morphogenesis domain-containing protein n=1 Tax=Solemya pervernicosa gill symbiont TaxID=642797 RepID=A0A1T2L9E2_9GAMM|nr:phage minor head protein [Solemya pervernicosa gill symbiont]OOZ41654.1 hypothetical protein BOW53_02960 [Solemya pervernicosa gill symbiont]